MRIFPVKSSPEGPRTTSRTVLLLQSAALLSLVACAVAYAWQRFGGAKDLGYLILLVVPGSATLAYLFVGTLVPNLLAAPRMKWPLMLTLPIVYAALLQLCGALWTTTANPLVRQDLISRSTGFWQHVSTAGLLLACQIGVLAIWAAVVGRKGRAE